MTKGEIKVKIMLLTQQYQAEMSSQNNSSSASRSYAKADRILSNIRELENELRTL